MTIFEGSEIVEVIHLHPIKDKEALHTLFKEKGLVKKAPEEVERILSERQTGADEEKRQAAENRINYAKEVEERRKNKAARQDEELAAKEKRTKLQNDESEL
mmetsp:Transcript_5016/g.6543  ORF Transcript_5016/g.6543 Transcript_5016/m.6543 type:complete len:102 (-) Transcript_5016:470-775(-)